MKIYLVRHAIAVDFGTPGFENDSLRPLTDKGREKMRRIAEALKELGVKPDLIVSSPYLRASQTASILVKALNYKEELIYSDNLIPMAESSDMIEEIRKKYSVDELMLVGHEPSISSLASALLTGNPSLSTSFKKGGVCCLSVEDQHRSRRAVLEWFLPPSISTRIS
jgi:phosphohistidine phosphatase